MDAAHLAIALSAAAGALALGLPPGVARLRRLALASTPASRRSSRASRVPDSGFLASARGRAVSAAVLGTGVWWFVGGFAGPAVGVGLGLVSWLVLGRLESAAAVRARAANTQALPLVADLLSSAVAAGTPPVMAMEVVADALGGSIGVALRSSASSAKLGIQAADWPAVIADPGLRQLARAVAGSVARGTSPVGVLGRLAHDARDAARWAAEARARSLGARAAAPLGLCFLPAFVLVGIVPVVVAASPFLP